MAGNLDMSLDDIIMNNKKSRGNSGNFAGRGRGRGRSNFGSGPDRRFQNRIPVRATPYSTRPLVPLLEPMLMHQMVVSEPSNEEKGTKLYVSNLDYGVSNGDIEILFSDVGKLKQHSIHYDRSGRSKGTAEVVFLRHSDALAAIKKYNNVELDGKPLKIELVGANLVLPTFMPRTGNWMMGNLNSNFRSTPGQAGSRAPAQAHGTSDLHLNSSRQGQAAGHRGSARGGFGRGQGRRQGRNHGEKVTAKDLDAELEKYHLEAMQIN
ncbi:hypothetical protein FNV43_RR24846 [Rhamnella rubrinervis]|uniref:RRM domain-containing protein n=1 Tax=Rhamnella rubrinervis TaxID=2594499 RepID=A0A8K0DT71_9ROSA|nr:hypothetical protein FNV43_RR24846 [Rhamnella rubrinervis]